MKKKGTKKEPKKKGRKQKYFTEEERREANCEKAKRYYQKNRELCIQKQLEKNKLNTEILRKYREGKLIETE
jgi:transposase